MKTNKSKIKGWLTLVTVLAALWGFATVVGPWGEEHIPVFNEIVDTIEARDIDSGAYFYTEIEASYRGEKELLGGLQLKQPDQSGWTLPFISGVISCLLILTIGFYTLPEK